jgi:hypothetical protein
MRKPCTTKRRLLMARLLCQRAQDATALALADRAVGEWWPGSTCDLFGKDLPKRRPTKFLPKPVG